MTAEIEIIYDRNIAAAALRSSDKYERLAAVVFHLLTDRTTVHDLRLRGASGVRHQIDVVLGPRHQRVLIECKDYDKNVGLPLVRNFFAEVEDLRPEEAIMVTTRGYSKQAQTYAASKNIRLALLRVPEERDFAGLIKRIEIIVNATARVGDPRIQWHVSEEDWASRSSSIEGQFGTIQVSDLTLALTDGSVSGFREVWGPIEGSIPLGSDGVVQGTHKFEGRAKLTFPNGSTLPVEGFTWEVEMSTFRASEIEIGDGVGGLVAELALRTLDGEFRQIFTNRQLARFNFDADGNLRPV